MWRVEVRHNGALAACVLRDSRDEAEGIAGLVNRSPVIGLHALVIDDMMIDESGAMVARAITREACRMVAAEMVDCELPRWAARMEARHAAR